MTQLLQLNVASVQDWQLATKTKGLRAKHSSAVVSDESLLPKLLVDTLEGKEPMKEAMLCIGSAGEAWLQPAVKLLKKYTVDSIDHNGWLVCVPIPGNSIEVSEVTILPNDFTQFFIVGLWGETLSNGQTNAQFGSVGDYVCRSLSDPADVWIVQRAIFQSTYEVI